MKWAQRTFIDRLRIHATGGAGGMGLPKFGGIGGKGGDVYVEAKEDFTLIKTKRDNIQKRYKADVGKTSLKSTLIGQAGKDVCIPAPLGTVVSTDNILLGELHKVGDKVLVAQGGAGGALLNQYAGQNGQAININLTLKLIADVGLLGFPNAGKSTLLRAISNAKPKIASYPFTTLQPNIGIVSYPDTRQLSIADLPGLVEGAWANTGMGHSFLKHIERTKILLYIIDISGFRLGPKYPHRNAIENVIFLNRELELYRPDLVEKPSLLLVNKMDLPGAEDELLKLMEDMENIQEVSSTFPEHVQPEQFVKFDQIIPCAARSNPESIEYVKEQLRDMLDRYSQTEEERHLTVQNARDTVGRLLSDKNFQLV